MTTPRDAIGLSDRLRERIRLLGQSPDSILKFMDRILPLIEEAAAALDALHGEISQWANEVSRYKAYAEKFDEENAALQARVKELEDRAGPLDLEPRLRSDSTTQKGGGIPWAGKLTTSSVDDSDA